MNTSPSASAPLLRDMAAFIRHPRAYQGDEGALSAGQRVLKAMRVWALLFSALLPFLCLIVIALMTFGAIAQRVMSGASMPIPGDPNDPLGGLQNQNALSELVANGNPLIVFFLAVIQSPIMEEIAFRLGLKPTRRNLSLGFAAFLYFIGLLVLDLFGKPRNSAVSSVSFQAAALNLGMAVAVIALLALMLFVVFSGRRLAWIQNFYARHFWLPYVASSVIFGAIHIANYTNPLLWLAAPILVFPQLLLGFGLGYVRVRFGFAASVFMHMLHNGLLMLPALMTLSLTSASPGRGIVPGLITAFVSAYCGLTLMLMMLNLVWSVAELRRPKTA